MAHEVESMFYVNEVPWHGLGRALVDPPTMEEAIIQAGLDWEVVKKPLFINGGLKIVPDRFAAVRSSDDSILGVVGKNWTALQNIDAFKFFQPFLDAGEAELETAGSLRGGRHVWILARVKTDPIDVLKDDSVRAYLMLANGHGGTMALTLAFTPIRVVCANTLACALADGETKMLRSIHTRQVRDNLELVRDTVNLVTRQFEATAEQYKLLAARRFNEKDLTQYVSRIFWPTPHKNAQVRAREEAAAVKLAERIMPRYQAGLGSELAIGTWWGAYNAITEHLSYDRGKSREKRMDALWFGGAAGFNARALSVALEMA